MISQGMIGSLMAAILLCLSGSGFTQDPAPLKVNVGSPIIDGTRLHPYHNQWRMTVVKPDGSVTADAGTWEDELKTIQIDGQPALERTQTATFKKRNREVGATTKTVNVFASKTLAPISRAFEKHVGGGSDSSLSIRFRDRSMRLERVENGTSAEKELPTAVAFDFYGGIYAVLWAAMPLKEQFSVTYPSYSEDEEHPEKVSWVTATVTGSESVEAGAQGQVKTWVVESDTDVGNLTYWVSPDAPYIIRMDYKQKDGTLWVLKMI